MVDPDAELKRTSVEFCVNHRVKVKPEKRIVIMENELEKSFGSTMKQYFANIGQNIKSMKFVTIKLQYDVALEK